MWRAFWLIIVITLTILTVKYLVKEPAGPIEAPDKLVELSIIGGNALMGIYPPSEIRTKVLGMLIEKIIFCESGGDPKAKNPKSTAYGLCQFIDGTWDYVQKKWGVELDRDNPGDQLYACERLLEEEGLKHWEPVWECIGYDTK